jgi:uncharacterized caspase-like protein
MNSRKALVVGINNYPNCPLSGCINDADAISGILERNGDNSVNFDVKKLTNIDTKGQLKGVIKECFNGDDDVALFYFSGHGFIDAVGGYIVTPDYSSEDWGVSMQEILTIVNDSKCRNRVVILDCCHSGFMGNITSTGQTVATIQDGVTILTASKSDEPAVETNGHGVFTALLVDALKGGASDVTGHITPGGIYAYIDKALGSWQQRPVFKTNVTRFSPLRTVKPQVANDILQRIIRYFPNPEQEHLLDPSYEPTNATDVEHNVVIPYANSDNVAIFKDLQKLESVGLVVPCGEEHMYFAAMNSKSCRLTSVGQHYWRLANDKKI